MATLDLAFSIKVFAALFAIMNPIANIPIFLSLTEGNSDRERRRVARTAVIGVTIGCAISAAAGSAILSVFGLSVNDFRLAGGLLVLLIALSMLHGSASGQHQPSDKELGNNPDQDIAIYPLTIPLLVGPGTIATLIIFGQTAMTEGKVAGFVLGLAVFLALLAIALFLAPFLAKYLSPKATAITQRLMGMILAAIAMQMIVASLQMSFRADRLPLMARAVWDASQTTGRLGLPIAFLVRPHSAARHEAKEAYGDLTAWGISRI